MRLISVHGNPEGRNAEQIKKPSESLQEKVNL